MQFDPVTHKDAIKTILADFVEFLVNFACVWLARRNFIANRGIRGERDIYKVRDLSCVKCIKDEDRRALVKEEESKERWRSYFVKLLIESHAGNLVTLSRIETAGAFE